MTGAETRQRLATGRRGLLSGAVGLGGLAGLALAAGRTAPARAEPTIPGVPPSRHLFFNVFRKGSQIGTHHLVFTGGGGTLTVQIAADFRVGLGPLTLFRYSLRTTEHWQDGKLMAATSHADDGGTKAFMTARRQGDALAVDGSKSGSYVAPAGSILGTHWNRAELKAPQIDPENGALMHFAVAEKGTNAVEVADSNVQATEYVLTGPATLNLWYDTQGIWSALRAVAKDGSIIDYHLT